MQYSARTTKYLHMPVQVLWFDSNEVVLLIFGYLCGLLLGGIWWAILFVVIPFLIIKKRKANRGYFNQMLYSYGLRDITGYPDPSAVIFWE